jgi:hypothetical protein
MSTMCPSSSSGARRVAIPPGGAGARPGLGSSQEQGFFGVGSAGMLIGSGAVAVVVWAALRLGLGVGMA